ncbi:MAG: VCBS domain-containing protein, partial [Rhodobacteraceae bacterium]|nr:VCBS domain-containing protein [Paracoccaceae bacterium]
DWTYTLDIADPTVDALGAGDTLTDTFTVEAADGTEQTVTITITGANEDINANEASDEQLRDWAAEIDDIDSITNLTLTIDGATAAAGRTQVFAEVSDAEAEALFTKATGGVTITGNDGADWIDLRGLETSGVGFTIVGYDTDAGGAGADGDNVIYASDGDDSITTGDGEDYIEVGAGADTVSAGAGDDEIAVRALHNGAGSDYDGGVGTDTLTVYGVNDLSGSTLTSIENLVMQPGSPSRVTMTVEQVAALDTITGAASGSELVIVEDTDGGVTEINLSGTTITGLGTLTAGPGVTVTVGVTQLAEIGELVTEGDGEIEITNLGDGEELDGDVDLSGADLGAVTIDLNVNGHALTLTAEQANGATLSGTGEVRIIGMATYGDGALNLADVAEGLDVTFVAQAGETVDVTANTWFDANDGNTDRIDAFEIEEGATLTIASDQAHVSGTGKPITGTGNLIVELGSDAFDLSGIAETVTASASVASGTVTLNAGATLGDLVVTVESGTTFELTAAQADGAGIDGAGTVNVTALEGDLTADLSTITAETVAVALDMDGSDATVAANLSTANTLAITSTGTDTATIAEAAVLGAGLSIAVGTGATLSITAADLHTITAVTGDGDVEVTGLDGAEAVLLSKVSASGTKTATVEEDVNFAGDLGTDFTTTVASGAMLTTTAAIATGQTIDGTGGVTITDLDQTATADLSNITATGTLLVEVDADTTLDAAADLGDPANGFRVDVAENATLTLDAADATGRTIAGDAASDAANTGGSVVITGLDTTDATTYDFTGVTAGGDGGSGTAGAVVVVIDADTELNAGTDLGIAQVTVASGATLTLTAAQADELEVTGEGDVVLTGYDGFIDGPNGALDLAGLADDLDVTLQLGMTANRNLTDDFSQVDTLEISGAHVATIDASATVHDGLSIDLIGATTLQISAEDAAALAGVSDNGSATIEVQALEGAQGADLGEVSANTVIVYVTTDDLAAPVEIAANLSTVDTLQVTGDGTAVIVEGTDGDADAEVGTDSLTIDVVETATLEIGAADAAALAGATGAGTVGVTGLEDAPGANLSLVGEGESFGQMVYSGLGTVFSASADNMSYQINGSNFNVNLMPGSTGALVTRIQGDLDVDFGVDVFDVYFDGDDLIIEALVAGQTFNSGVYNNNTKIDLGEPDQVAGTITPATDGTTVNVSMEMTENTEIEASADLSTADRLTISSDGTGPYTATIAAGATLNAGLEIVVQDGSTLSLGAAHASAVASVTANETGAGVAVTGLEDQTNGGGDIDADLSGVTADTLTAALDSTGDVTIDDAADLGDAVVTITGSDTVTVEDGATIGGAQFVIATDATLTLAASQATGLSVTEADPGGVSDGTVAVTALDDTDNADLSGLTVTTVTAAVALNNETVTFTGDLGRADVTITGVGGGTSDIFDVTNATMGTATFDVQTAATLQGTAAKLDGVQASGAGVVNLTETTFTADTDLSGITTSEIRFNGVGDANLTVSSGTLTIRQDHLADIGDDGSNDISGAGNVTVTEVDGSVDLSEIGVGGTVTAVLGEDVTIGNSDDGLDVVAVFEVGENDLTIDAGKAHGKTITATGNGTVTITGASAAVPYDFSQITAETPVTIEFATGGTLNADTQFVDEQEYEAEIAVNQTLTLSADRADGVTITGNAAGDGETGGSVVISQLDGEAAYDLSAVTPGGASGTGNAGTVTATVGTVALDPDTLLGDHLALTVTGTLNLTGAQADDRAIDGGGSLVVTAFAGDTDLQNVAGSIDTVTGRVDAGDADVSGNASVNNGDVDAFVVEGPHTLTLAAARFEGGAGSGLTVSGDGAVVVSGATVATAYDFSDITAAGTVRVAFDDTGSVDAATVLTGVDELSLASGDTTTLTQVQADGITFTGGGPVSITASGGQQSLSGTTLNDTFHADDDGSTLDLLDITQGGSDTLVFTTAANGFLVTGFDLGDVGAGEEGDVIDLSGVNGGDGLNLRNDVNPDGQITFQYYDSTVTPIEGEVIVFTALEAPDIASVVAFAINSSGIGGGGQSINDQFATDGNSATQHSLLFAIASGDDPGDSTTIWHWQDDGTGGGSAGDVVVDEGELTLVATLEGVTLSDLPNLDSSNLIT